MFKNSQKISISKHFLISLAFIVLLFASFGVSVDESYASDLNQSAIGLESELNVEDKLENSQKDSLSMSLENSDSLGVSKNNEILGAEYTLNGGTFADIRNKVNSAKSGDTIKLKGTFVAEKNFDYILVNKKLTFIGDSSTKLDAKKLTHMFVINSTGAGSTFKNIKFVNGYRNGNGGAVYVNTNNVSFINCEFRSNSAYHGGAITTKLDEFTSANLLVENCKFIKNHADSAAPAISAHGNNSRIINCTFDSNDASNNLPGVIPLGGAIQMGIDGSSPTGYVYDCIFKNNYVQPKSTGAHGGAGCVRDGIEYKNCIFINNSAAQGGALTFHASGLIDNCTFINNSATYYGGALSTGFKYEEMELFVKNCIFEGNSAPIGGAVQLIGKDISIDDSIFEDNVASQYGGAINLNAQTVTISDSEFNDNLANINGGAVYINGEKTLIQDSSFISNDAIPDVEKLDDGLGGAIFINSTQATVKNNDFYYNTARNGSAIYYDKYGSKLTLSNNTLYQNQAWVYALPIYAHDIYYGEVEHLKSIIHGGNNIAKYGDLAVSNAIYNAAGISNIEIDGETPVLGATTSGHLYQDDREYNMEILLTVTYEDGSVIYNNTLNSNTFGEVNEYLENLKVGTYYVSAKHFEDTYYKAISNTTSFIVTKQVDNKIKKSVSPQEINYDDVVVWTLNITNNGPSNATGVVVRDVLPEGLEYLEDDSGLYDPVTGTLNIGFLAVGEVIVVNIKTLVKKTGVIVNKANVTAKEYDYNLTNNFDESNVNVNPACDLAVVKTVNASVVNIGDVIKWTLTVTNNGPDTATGVVARDVIPKGLIVISSTGKYDKNTGEWDIGTLNKGSTVKLDIVCKVNVTGLIENEVYVSGNQYDYDETNNYDNEIIRVNPASDLAIVKVVNASVVNYGDVVRWTLTVSNLGPDDATGVVVYDRLPEGFVYLNSTMPYVNDEFAIGNLAVGKTINIDIFCRVNVTGEFVNVASVKGNEHDPNLDNNKDDSSIYVKPAIDLAIEKSVNESTPKLNDLIQWTITVTNHGPDAATGVIVRDVLPDGLIFRSSTGNYNKNTGEWNIGTLNKGSTVSLSIVCKVNKTGVSENEVSVTGNEYDIDESNNYDSEIIEVDSASDLAIVKVVNASVVNYGDVVRWTLTVSNLGPDDATGVVVYDRLPEGFVYLNSTMPYVNDEFAIGNLAVGKTINIDIFCMANITGEFVNVATVKGNEFDPNLSNNKDNSSILVKPASDLIVTKDVNQSKPQFKDLIQWTINVHNNGPDTATGVTVSDMLPKSLIWIEDNSLGKYNHNSGIWNIGNLAKGETKTLIITTRVNATGIIRNNVSVTGNEFDYNKSNNNDSEIINVSKSSDLEVIKFANVSEVNYHQLVKWTIIAINHGPDKATGVSVDEILPEGLTVVNYTLTKGAYGDGVWAVCCIESGESQTLELICYVNKTGTLTNVVVIEGNEYDPDLSNNKDNSTVIVPKSSDLGVVKTVDNPYPDYGDVIEWYINVTNNGPDDAFDIVVKDLLPDGLELLSYNSTSGDFDGYLWHIDSLNNGYSELLVLRCLVQTLDDVENIAEVIPSQYDWNESNNNDSEIITVNPVADLSIIKLVNASTANYLDLIRWTLIVTNHGPNDATGVIVSDVIPKGLSIVKVIGEGLYENSIWDIGDLANGESTTLDIICKIQATGDFTNIANVWAEQKDPDWDNNVDENYLHVAPASDLAITKTVSKYQYSVGDLVKYTIKLTNKGPDMAKNVKVKEIMDTNLLLQSFEASMGTFDESSDVWSLDELDVGESALLKINAIAKAPGIAKNDVSVESDTYDPDLGNNNDTVSINVSENHKPVKKFHKKHDKPKSDEFGEVYESILQKYQSGNPIMVIVLLFVFSMGALYGKNILKKR